MIRKIALICLLAGFTLAMSGAASHADADADTKKVTQLRIATLAPSGSSWMKVFNAWNKTLQKETNGTLKLRFYPGGSQGDERDFVRKMRADQMDGAAITTTGLGMIVRPIIVLAAPGVVSNYKELADVRAKLADKFEKMFSDGGYKLLGWGDAGRTRMFSATTAIMKPSDLKGVRPWAWKDDLLFTEMLKIAGANGVRLGVNEVYPALQTRMIDTLPSSALAAVALQWYTRLKYVSKDATGVIVGGTIIKKEKFDSLTPDQQKALLSTSKRAHAVLRKSIARDDDKAFKSIQKRGVEVYDAKKHEAEWNALAKKTRTALAGRVYPQSLLTAVMAAAGK